MDETLRRAAENAKGFMPTDEGTALYDAAVEAVKRFPDGVLGEVGTYCGKSTLYLAAAVREAGGGTVVTVDHHIGSEENQPGWEWHDPTLVDPHARRLDTLPELRRNLYDAGVEDVVFPVAAVPSWSARAGRPRSRSCSSTAVTPKSRHRPTTTPGRTICGPAGCS